ncbi:MAG: response regulator [Campylobacterota bacterium]|nr:response regulator [Campylobacterota bacterium]
MKKLTLLCVEDDAEALEDIVYLVKRYFDKVYTASDGEMALDLYNSHQPDIILLDINIPKLNGLQVASQIRKEDDDTPIIFLTAHSEKDKLLQAIELHVSSYIIKPFKVQELTDNIFKAINKINNKSKKVLLVDNFTWNKDTNELFYGDTKISITKNELLLVKFLFVNKTIYFNANDISSEIGSNQSDFTGNNIVQLISRFKKKIKKLIKNDDFFIENTYGAGYRIK